MEDIKILEALKNRKLYFTSNMFQTGWVELDDNEKQAIENLIARNKELELALANSVSKDEVNEVLNKLIKEADYRTEDNPKGRVHFHKEPVDYQIEIIQELLNKGE